ncbi:glycoside hydrolase family 5 protein [Mycena alexandri]|uniref:glucan 1,3-beta-glucosidase n=1 Tax=Mycena alexandri TaxID=1745969 RepID=A0AAD6WN45_9AGAR|nr:glycoside hydrolase family 5 protein [Mycena alexandri]KAJ7018695.1 glycoside hydrolase family 5 protein [Mycena alexandri]
MMQELQHDAPAASPYLDSDFDLPRSAYVTHDSPSLNSRAEPYHDDPEGYPPPSASNSTTFLPISSSKAPEPISPGVTSPSKTRRLVVCAVLAVVIVAAVMLPIYFLDVKKHDSATTSGSSTSGGTSTDGQGTGSQQSHIGAVIGGDGSTVVTADGDTFIYNNPFGGYWIADPDNPFASGARPNSWTPALNESWTWGVDRIHGVNLGGFVVLEPFITPALFQPYPSAGDEWDLSTLMRVDGTLEAKLEEHYATFITEQDIAQIAGAGLNWVRLPIPFWAVSTWSDIGVQGDGTSEGEPFLEGVAWKYIVRLLGWARKYGIRVNIDLHTVPGSQNGYNHSGKRGQINFLNGIMGTANAQRTLDYIRIIAEFISQPEYQDVVGMFGVVNEALLSAIGRPQLSAFYYEVHNTIRSITGFGEGKGPYISMHDGFDGLQSWAGFLTGSDRIILDTHPYFSFGGQPNNQPIATSEDPATAGGPWPGSACSGWGPGMNTSRQAFGVTVAGEFSNGYNDCGLYLTGVNGSQSYGGDCSLWEDSSTWNTSVKAGVMQFALASMDALGDWFFWTWKIGNATDGVVRSPLWSYQLGLEGGWMPTDPRSALGKCEEVGVTGTSFDGTYSAWQTGGAGAGTIDASETAVYGTWPPATISNVPANALTLVPTYTATGSVPTLTYITPTPTGSAAMVTPTVSIWNGWFDSADTAQAMTAVAGCTYPDAWRALDSPAPTAVCNWT